GGGCRRTSRPRRTDTATCTARFRPTADTPAPCRSWSSQAAPPANNRRRACAPSAAAAGAAAGEDRKRPPGGPGPRGLGYVSWEDEYHSSARRSISLLRRANAWVRSGLHDRAPRSVARGQEVPRGGLQTPVPRQGVLQRPLQAVASRQVGQVAL